MIKEFKNEFWWLSNFASVEIKLDGLVFISVEHAYMSAKSDDVEWKTFCCGVGATASQVKKASKNIQLVKDWDFKKIEVMRECLMQKFLQEPYKANLLKTGNQEIQEGNRWGDKFWGVYLNTGVGENNLGKIIMKIRDCLTEKDIKSKKGIEIFTDGSSLAKKGHKSHMKGGCAAVFTINGVVKKTISKGYFPTKIGRMELLGIITALKVLAKDQKATIFSDSMYAISGINKGWLKNWERDGWPSRIKNQDLQKQLLEEYRKFRPGAIKFKHVPGHQGNIGNEAADMAASYKNFTVFEKDIHLTEKEMKLEKFL